MSQNKGKKRNKAYYVASAKKRRWASCLDAGMKGFLVTCNNQEKQCVRESYNLLNEYADKLYGPQVKKDKADSASEEDEEDIEKALQKEVADIKETKKDQNRFQQVESGANNCIFIKTTLEDPCHLVHSIFTDLHESKVKKARFMLRLLPIAATCHASIENIKTLGQKFLEPYFKEAEKDGLSHCIRIKVRNNNTISRTAIIPELARVISDMNPSSKVEYNTPDMVVLVEILRTTACMSVVRDFYKYRQYNLHEVVKEKSDEKEVEKSEEKEVEKSDEKEVVPNATSTGKETEMPSFKKDSANVENETTQISEDQTQTKVLEKETQFVNVEPEIESPNGDKQSLDTLKESENAGNSAPASDVEIPLESSAVAKNMENELSEKDKEPKLTKEVVESSAEKQ